MIASKSTQQQQQRKEKKAMKRNSFINWNDDYNFDMKLHNKDYHINLDEMYDWICANFEREDKFKKDMLSNDNLFALAIDYSIPVIMVKYFKRQVVKW